MCLESIFATVFNILFLFYCCQTVVVRSQTFPSPCPRTFQYEMDQNGEIYGTIGVYSFDRKIVRLNVQLSVGNTVNGYNGQIVLENPKEKVLNDIENQRPVRYKVFFPSWKNIPPRVTQILVNGNEVCSGPPMEFNRWISVVTTVNLQHTLRLINELVPLPSQNPYPNNNAIGDNPFFPRRDKPQFERNPFFNNNGGFNGPNNYDGFSNALPTTPTTVRTTTQKTSQPPAVNDLLISDNPFLSGKGTIPRPSPTTNTPNTPIRGSPRPSTTTSSTPSSLDICGLSVNPNPLVVNGNHVPVGAYPWLTAMFASTGTGFEYKCGGSLVSKKHVVTAAHCLHEGRKRLSPDKIFLILGKLNIQSFVPSENEKVVGADDIRIHPDYVPLSSDADIAIVILAEDIEFSKFIRPICIWAEGDDIDSVVGHKGKVIGWGRDENNNSMTAEPRQIDLPIVSQEVCLRSSEAFKYITSPRTFCAGDRNDNGPCNGDSGSGFVMQRNGRWSLRGVVSISTYDPIKQSCDLSNYIVFTDVSKFKAWLLSIILFI